MVGDFTRSTLYSTWPVYLIRQTGSSTTSSSLVDGLGQACRRAQGRKAYKDTGRGAKFLGRDRDDVHTYLASILLSNATVCIVEWVGGANQDVQV